MPTKRIFPGSDGGARIEARQARARDARAGAAAYEIAARATDAKTARLKALRLAKEAAEAEAKASVVVPIGKQPPRKRSKTTVRKP